MSKIVKIKAKQKPKDNYIKLYFVSSITDLYRYDVLSRDFYSTPNTAIVSYVVETYKYTNVDFGTNCDPKLHLTIGYYNTEIINLPIAIYTVTTDKSNTKFNGKYYSIIDYYNYSIKKRITTLNELASEYNISIHILNGIVSKDNKIDLIDDANHCDKSDNVNTNKDFAQGSYDPFDNASTDKNLSHKIHELKEIRYSSVATDYSDDIATIKGHIYDTMQCRYISIILDATLKTLMIPPEKIYLLNMESIQIKESKFERKDIVKSIKSFIELQDAFMEPGSVFIPFYVDTGSESSKNLINMLIEAGFQGIWSLYMYTNEPNSNKVFEELLKMENHK